MRTTTLAVLSFIALAIAPASAFAAAPSCALSVSNPSPRVGDRVTFSWTSAGATSARWVQNAASAAFGLSSSTLPVSGSQSAAVTDPSLASPTLQVSSATTTIAKTGVATLPGYTNAIGLDVVGKYAYTADAGASFQFNVVDISNPASPVVVGTVSDVFTLAGAFTVRVAGTYAYVTENGTNRLTVIDISKPTAPKIVASVVDARMAGPRGLTLVGTRAYVAGNSAASLAIIDISNPLAPKMLGAVVDRNILAGADSVVVVGNYAYVTAGDSNTLAVIDISNPALPKIVGTYSSFATLANPKDLFVSGKYAYVTALASNSFTVIDISNPAAPTLVSSINDRTLLYAPKNMMMVGQYAYVTANSGSTLAIINAADPKAPTIIASIYDPATLSNARSVFVSGNLVYVVAANKFSVLTVNMNAVSSAYCTVTFVPPPTTPAAASALTDSIAENGAQSVTTLSGSALGASTLTVLAYPSTDYDTVSFRSNAVAVANGRWTLPMPLKKGTYLVELHSASLAPSSKSFLGTATIAVDPQKSLATILSVTKASTGTPVSDVEL